MVSLIPASRANVTAPTRPGNSAIEEFLGRPLACAGVTGRAIRSPTSHEPPREERSEVVGGVDTEGAGLPDATVIEDLRRLTAPKR